MKDWIQEAEEIIKRNLGIKPEPTFAPRSNAVRTSMFAVCKGCQFPNSNGFQYCDSCHSKYRGKRT